MDRRAPGHDRPLAAHGLTWAELTAWWADREDMAGAPAREISSSLYRGLDRSLGANGAARRVLRTYADRYVRLGPDISAGGLGRASFSLSPVSARRSEWSWPRPLPPRESTFQPSCPKRPPGQLSPVQPSWERRFTSASHAA